jgi:death-on-curing protein
MLIEITEELINIIHHYVVTKLTADEGIVYSGTITGTVHKVFSTVYGEKKYESIYDKAGALLYSIVNGHSFTDGNKRTGLLTTCLFLYYNGYHLRIPPDCAKYLENMADAKNPNAPTEADAINWIRKNAVHNMSSGINSFMYALGYRMVGRDYFVYLTKTILDRDVIPYIDRKKLVDYDLLKTRREKWKKRGCNNSGQKT